MYSGDVRRAGTFSQTASGNRAKEGIVSQKKIFFKWNLLDEGEQNIVIFQWRSDQLFAEAEGRGK